MLQDNVTGRQRIRKPSIVDVADEWISGDCDCEFHANNRRNPYLFNTWYGKRKEYIDVDQVPDYALRKSPYILTGYRCYYTTWQCIKSIFAWHNETMNIWTQIVFFLWDFYEFFYEPWDLCVTWMDTWMIVLGYLGRWSMLLSSVAMHTMSGHYCIRITEFFNRLDFAGIIVLNGALGIESYYILLHQERFHGPVMNMISVFMLVCSMIGLMFVWTQKFNAKEYRPIRVLFFLLIAIASCSLWFYCIHLVEDDVSLSITMLEIRSQLIVPATCLGTAIAFYTTRFPEILFPRIFDYLISSHGFHHIFSFLSCYSAKHIISGIRHERLSNMVLMKNVLNVTKNVPSPIYRLLNRIRSKFF